MLAQFGVHDHTSKPCVGYEALLQVLRQPSGKIGGVINCVLEALLDVLPDLGSHQDLCILPRS